LGLVNGLLIGLAVGLGAWGAEALRVTRLPVPLYAPTLILGLIAATLLGGLTGWLTARLARPILTVLLWVIVAIVSMYLINYLPYQGRTLVAWLADPRFWGKPIFPYTLGGSNSGLILGGLLLILTLGVLGLLQGYRLENLVAEVGRSRVLNGRGWVALLLPMPFVFLASLITQNVMANPAAPAVELTHRALTGVQGFEGDYRALGDSGGVNFAALSGLEGRLEGEYSLGVAEVNPSLSAVIVAAAFANGNRVYCRVINDQLIYCYDAIPAYRQTLESLIAGAPLPDPCRDCDPAATAAWGDWFAARREALGTAPQIEQLAQQGSHTLFQVTGESGATIECWFEGISPIRLTECHDAGHR
jgi:hypothetical protein